MKHAIFVSGLLALLVLQPLRAADSPEDFDTTAETVGWQTNGLETPVNQLVTPAGVLVELPHVRPNAIALSPDGNLIVTSGRTRELIALDPVTGKILQRVPLPTDVPGAAPKSVSDLVLNPTLPAKLSFTGLTFSPDGSRVYLSNVNGDLKVFAVGKDQKISPLFSLPLPGANRPGRKNDVPTGIAVSPDGARLYVALNVANQLLELEAATGKFLRTWDVGNAPYDVALADKKIYVSNWGGRRPGPDSLAGPIGRNGVVRVDENSVASEGSVSIIDLAGDDGSKAATAGPSRIEVHGATLLMKRNAPQSSGGSEHNSNSASGRSEALREILTGRHACALALSPNGKFLVCANAGSDTLSVIDTRTDKIVETICARQNPGDLFGAQPNALAFDESGKTLFVCNGTQNAVAVVQFKPGESRLLGLIPVGWFPCGIACDARRNVIDVANIKSISPKMEEAKKGRGYGYNTHQYYGSLSFVPVPSGIELEKFTQTALANLRYPLLAQAKLPARENQPARPVPERVGEPSVFQHVIYIIKENRSYDQVLGDVTEGDGSADLCVFGARITPNQHQLVHDFALLDNTYCSGILSAEGHQWTDSAMANDYVERSYAGWPRSYPGGADPAARDAMAYSSAGFIWNDAAAHGKTVADFGEFTTEHKRWKSFLRRDTPSWLDSYRDFTGGADKIAYAIEPDMESLRPFVIANYPGFDLKTPDVLRAARFIEVLKQFEAGNNFPNLAILWLPNDHTCGTKFGFPTPDAMAADNDLAFGQIVEAVSHGKFWTNTCIFAIEDDPQDGWDHVSAYRTTAYVISPYTKRHAVIRTQYNQTSLLRTMELMLGLPPMNQMDATATPMFDCFTNLPDFTAFNAVTNQVPLDQMNPDPKKVSNPVLRKDALISARLPLEKEDQCPEDLFNHILWRATKGPQTPYPDWAVKVARDDD